MGKIYSLFAKQVEASPELYNMCVISEIVFQERKNLIVPTDDEVRNEFSKVKRLFIPLNNVLRIDELENLNEKEVSDPHIEEGDTESKLIRPVEFFRR